MQLDVGICQREQRIEVACNECAQETTHDLSNVLIVLARELWGADLVDCRWVKGAFDVGKSSRSSICTCARRRAPTW